MTAADSLFIRSATLVGYSEAARDVGLDPENMLKAVGLDPTALNDPDRAIPLYSFMELLVLSAKKSGYEDFGIRAAYRRGVPDLGPASLLIREAETVEEAIRYYSSHLYLHSDGTVIRLDRRFDSPVIIVEIVGKTLAQSIQATQFGITGMIMQIRWLIGEEYQPQLVSFSHDRPKGVTFARRVFQCEIRYNQILSGIVLDSRLLERRVVTSSPFLRKLTLKHLNSDILHPRQRFSERVKALMRMKLSEGCPSSDLIAHQLGIDRRTLNRRLSREGETYSTLLRSVRIEAVRIALENSLQPLAEVALAVGFSSLSAFSRWFKSEFDCTPSAWRRRLQLIGNAESTPVRRPR